MEGKVVAVTGAGSGIGRATALAFARLGALVVAADVDRTGLEKTRAELEARGKSLHRARPADVASRTDLQRIVDDCLELGGLDVMVANAGISLDAPFLDVTDEELDRTLAVNLKGVFLCGQLAARAMIQRKTAGVIVNVASTYSEVTAFGCSAYSASKGGVRMLTKSMALELGPYGIRVNAVGPGDTRTGMNSLDDERTLREIEERIPLGRVGQPGDIADAIVWLASNGARHVTGQTLFVDGGFLVR